MAPTADEAGNVPDVTAACGLFFADSDPQQAMADWQTRQCILLSVTENQYTHPVLQDAVYQEAYLRTDPCDPGCRSVGVVTLFCFAEMFARVQTDGDGQISGDNQAAVARLLMYASLVFHTIVENGHILQ